MKNENVYITTAIGIIVVGGITGPQHQDAKLKNSPSQRRVRSRAT